MYTSHQVTEIEPAYDIRSARRGREILNRMVNDVTSYRQLLQLPHVSSFLLATCLSRLANGMSGLAIVLYALAKFDAPALIGWISFAAVAPGLVASPLAGAFLDRIGATYGIVADVAAGALLMVFLIVLDRIGWVSPMALILLVLLFSLCTPLGAAGIRAQLPRLVPANVLDRVNALDTTIHAIVALLGPSLAGGLVGFGSPVAAWLTIASAYVVALMCILRLRQSPEPCLPSESFLAQAIAGLVHVVRQPSLRGLAVGYALSQVTWGVLFITVPVVLTRRFDAGVWESVSGLLWAATGLAGGLGALAAGRLRVRGRETCVMTLGMVVTAFAAWPLAAELGLPGLASGLVLAGIAAGPIDVAALTLRQRRTEPGRLGRVMAVSMSFNMSGFPIGTALGGMLVAQSLSAAFAVAALASMLAAAATYMLIPAHDVT